MKFWKKQIVCVFVSFALIFAPARQAQAVVPVLVAYGLTAVTASGVTFSAADMVGLSIAAAGLGAIAYMKLTGADGSEVRIPMQNTAANPAALPPAPAATSTLSATNTYTYSATLGAGYGTGSTPNIACAAVAAYFYTSYGYTASTSSCSFWNSSTPGAPQTATMTQSAPIVACPSGYTVSGSSCNLANAYAAVQDNKQDFTRSATAFAPIAGDQYSVTGLSATQSSDGALVILGKSPSSTVTCNGSPCDMAAYYKILADGGTYQVTSTQRYDTAGTPYVAQQSITLSPAGEIVSYGTNNVAGTVNMAAATASTAPVTGAVAGSVAPVPTASSSSAGAIPSDYNREVTQAQIAADIAAGNAARDIETANANTAGAAAGAALAALPESVESVAGLNLPTENTFSSALPNGIDTGMPHNDESCVALDFEMPVMGTLHIAPCAVVNAVRPLVNYMIIALGVLGGIMVWIRPGGAEA